MKIVVSCDALVARDYAVSVVESMLLLYEEAELYTIVHHEGKILGPVEQRKIHSSFLSHILTDEMAFGDQWWKKAHLIPGALKKLHIPCNVDLIINISSGFSQGITKCDGVKQITYLVDNQFEKRKTKFFREKIFRGYLENWAEKGILSADELWVPTERSAKYWSAKHPNVSVLPPFFKATDFPLFPEATRKAFPNDFFAIETSSLTLEKADQVIGALVEKGIKFKMVGRDAHLESLKEKYQNSAEFWGWRCSGELAPILAAARGYICFQESGFPINAIEALSVGTPIWISKDSLALDYLDDEKVGIFTGLNFVQECEGLFEQMKGLDIKKVHGSVQKFHDLKFRSWVHRQIEKRKESFSEEGESCGQC